MKVPSATSSSTAFDSPPRSRVLGKLREGVAVAGEPFVSGRDPATLAPSVRRLGLALVEKLDRLQVEARYARPGAKGRASATTLHIALARSA